MYSALLGMWFLHRGGPAILRSDKIRLCLGLVSHLAPALDHNGRSWVDTHMLSTRGRSASLFALRQDRWACPPLDTEITWRTKQWDCPTEPFLAFSQWRAALTAFFHGSSHPTDIARGVTDAIPFMLTQYMRMQQPNDLLDLDPEASLPWDPTLNQYGCYDTLPDKVPCRTPPRLSIARAPALTGNRSGAPARRDILISPSRDFGDGEGPRHPVRDVRPRTKAREWHHSAATHLAPHGITLTLACPCRVCNG